MTLYISRGGYNSPVRRRSPLLIVPVLLALAATAGAQSAAAPSRSLVYGGDHEFPPYEYLDEQGSPKASTST
jgi:hypothetical protein